MKYFYFNIFIFFILIQTGYSKDFADFSTVSNSFKKASVSFLDSPSNIIEPSDSLLKGNHQSAFLKSSDLKLSYSEKFKLLAKAKKKKKPKYEDEDEDEDDGSDEAEEDDEEEEEEDEKPRRNRVEDEEEEEEELEEDSEEESDEDEEDEPPRKSKRKAKKSKRSYEDEDEDESSDEDFEDESPKRKSGGKSSSDGFILNFYLGTQYNEYKAIDRASLSATGQQAAPAQQQPQTTGGQILQPAGFGFTNSKRYIEDYSFQQFPQGGQQTIPAQTGTTPANPYGSPNPQAQPTDNIKPGVAYKAFPSISGGAKGEFYLLNSKVNSFGLEGGYIGTVYFPPVTYNNSQTRVRAYTHNIMASIVWRFRPMKKYQTLSIKPKVGGRVFAFDGQNIKGKSGQPLFLFVDSQYMGLNISPLNLEFYFTDNPGSRFGMKLSYDIFLSPTYKESIKINKATTQKYYISGDKARRTVNMINNFIEGGLLLDTPKILYQFTAGYYMLDVYYKPYADGTANIGTRGNLNRTISNAHLMDRYISALFSLGFKF